MTVAAVIPTIGRATLAAAIDSVVRQSYPVYEIVIVNDAPDQTPRTPHLPVTVKEVFTGGRIGEARSRQIGIEHATAHLVAFLDDDDLWLPHHIRSSMSAFAADPDLDLYAATSLLAYSKRVETSSRVNYRGHQHLVDFFYGPRCFAGRRRSVPTITWVFRRNMLAIPFESALALSPEIWWLICQDESGRKMRQFQGVDAVWFNDLDRMLGRYSLRSLSQYAALLETVRPGAGGRYLVGHVWA
jgi:hypothetical protein